MNDRIAYYDILRAIAIIGVLAIHCTFLGFQFEFNSFDFNITVLWKNFINFSVPLFISLSGFFSANKNVETKENYLLFIKKQIPRVLIPYIIWSILYLGLSAYFGGAPFNELFVRFITFQSSPEFYFILLIIQYYLLLPVLKKLASSKGLYLSLAISLISCVIIFKLRYFNDYLVLQILYTGLFPIWLIFFVFGLYIRNNQIKLNNKLIIVLAFIFYVLSIVETLFSHLYFNIEILFAATSVKVSSFLFSLLILMYAFKNISMKENKILQYTGEVSFGIFLSHPLFLYYPIVLMVNIFLTPLFNKRGGGILLQLLVLFTTYICCLLFSYILRKINKKLAIKLLGS
jgi:surface polysaccharide O-acyltransferase-like enzyme